ncbi:hypothetical protein Bbelb_119220 [Branchiostoma belcheri]|nr:hypothetical protein Bbelb_119220 [Branchiostoma belcheri]
MERRLSALKVWLLFSVLSLAANESCSPECRWVSCSDGRLQFSGSWFKTRNVNHPCLTCSKGPGPIPDASCFRHPKWVGVRGVPFGVLSAAKLPIPERTQLAFLALVDTEITDLEQNTLANLSTLQELHMEFNKLTEVKTSYFTAGDLRHLRTLSLAHNQISHLESGCFQDLTGLWQLILWRNQLTYIDHSSFLGLLELRELVLGFNRIETIHGRTFESFSQHKLRLVDVSRNSLVQACLSPELFYGFDNNELIRSLLIVKLSNTHSANTDVTKQWSLSLRISSHMRQISAVLENSILCLRQGHNNEYQLQWNEKKSKDDILGANSLCSALDSLETRPKSATLVSPFVIVLAKAGNQGEPTESMEMKNINARGRASSSPVVALEDNIFDRLHRSTHLKRQYSVPNNPANKNGRRSAHDTPFDAPHYWEIPDSLVDSTQQPAPGKLDAPNYWEIPDALVDSVPNSDEVGTTREISGALANSTRDPVTDEARYSEIPDADTIRSQHRPSSLPMDTFLCTRTVPDNTTNSAPRPASLPHQYWHITDADIGGDSVTFYASAAETKFSVATKSEDNNRLYKTETTQEGDGQSIPATYGTDSAQTASVVLEPED